VFFTSIRWGRHFGAERAIHWSLYYVFLVLLIRRDITYIRI